MASDEFLLADIQKIETFIIQKLKSGLDHRLSYHGVHHTLDVVTETMRIAAEERITDVNDLELLKISAFFHDSGFLYVYRDHEERSCVLAQQFLPAFGITKEQLNSICGMIRATRIPQSPQNYLEGILCDADVDYLGRDDFYSIGRTLYHEWKAYGFVSSEEDWNRKQVKFMESHHYFTSSSKNLRAEKKRQHMDEVKQLVSSYKN